MTTRKEIAMILIEETEEAGKTLTVTELNRILDKIEDAYKPVLQDEYENGYEAGYDDGQKNERPRA